MEKVLFLDSRDIIDCVEKHDPCGASKLARELSRENAAIILTFTNVLESIPRNRGVAYAVEFARRLASIPHTFVAHTELSTLEFREAVATFGEGRPPVHQLPRFANWARYVYTFAPQAQPSGPEAAALDTVALPEHVRTFFLDDRLLEFDPSHRARITATFEQNRKVLGRKRPNREILQSFVEDQLALLKLEVSSSSRFAEWLYRDTSVCPGWRLMMEASEEFRCDVTTPVATGDLPDLTHLYLVPYARAATLDRKWREYIARAARRLQAEGIATNYRVYRDLAGLRARWRAAD